MNYDDTKSDSPLVTSEDPTTNVPAASTARRTVTAILVLVAALLLGYVMYVVNCNHLNDSASLNPDNSQKTNAPAVDEVSEYTSEQKLEILSTRSAEETQKVTVYDEETGITRSEDIPKQTMSEAEKLSIMEERQAKPITDFVTVEE